ncbi:peptidylprolyl isomerase [Sulfobacillus thermosulfidooxidans]|uniref:Peptidyl-prolyl cis-trans isomerase n=2 Tax=Sulfobacillus thermosulfidooxidans TaxID=28034 RepID=A0A1W1WKV3_SULTA|nr:peptidylprolyl isomerase [Sulfobacillus thermosulfidooxidans]OLZ08878.1 peptidylprolyl isomerase [Sulfobacillus thermosulfidooxidans]OLZ14754.1 peptidylprolyl isomerase [Sulfobacillus thermosulfidooxidans]OLZ22102.1 peptidylprolyl isomerase [Sulfobacillus thermosulfidooxidans]SMC06812.1 Peptidyl-prolyl cis-trans isomerase (rotamase)-cyclophilin family [Sulfobacillus thermosulfidooxidans DSM 9293]
MTAKFFRFWSIIGVSGILATVTAGCGQQAAKTPAHTKQIASGRNLRWNAPPKMFINPNKQYTATVDTTAGKFVISLFAKQDPVAVNNFVFLADHNFFNGDEIFRVIKPFMFQTGDPLNNGTGGPGYQWNGEKPTFPYQPGIVAMANANNPNTNGSQFFVCTGPESTSLNQDPIYTELGRVTQGWNVVQKIASGAVKTNPMTGEDSLPIHPYYITSVTISVGASQ